MPAGPAPMTNTFLGLGAGTKAESPSLPTSAFTEHFILNPRSTTRMRQSIQAVHLRIS
jgi:hypothetical protein